MTASPRRLKFVRFATPYEALVVGDAFDRGGFFEMDPELCYMRCGAFILEDLERRTHVVVVCRNNNDLHVWQ